MVRFGLTVTYEKLVRDPRNIGGEALTDSYYQYYRYHRYYISEKPIVYMSEDTVQFRSKPIKEVLESLKEIRVGGLNESEVGREAVERLIPEILSDREKIELYEMYERGEISEDAVRIALGDDFDEMERMIEDTSEMAEKDTSRYLAE